MNAIGLEDAKAHLSDRIDGLEADCDRYGCSISSDPAGSRVYVVSLFAPRVRDALGKARASK
jgi:hypothetical protein